MSNKKELPFRIGVGIVLLNSENKIFVAKRIDNPENFWQMPQGGANVNESLLDAAKRELKEETGIRSIKIIKELVDWLEYDLPKNLIGKIWKGKYRGQKQKWFIMQFLGNDSEVNLKTENPEFLDWKWIDSINLTNQVVHFKSHVYKKIQKELKSLGLI